MNRRPLGEIADADVQSYAENGVVRLRGLFDSDWVSRMRAAVDRLRGGGRGRDFKAEGDTGSFWVESGLRARDDDFRAFAHESPAAEIAAATMRSHTARFFADRYYVKEPRTTTPTPWHHDLPYLPLTGEHICSIWLALEPVTLESSGLEYLAGSHRWGLWYDETIEPCPDYGARRGDPSLRFLSWEMAPGDCLVHHPLVLHWSWPNRSATQRRSNIDTVWAGDDVRYEPREAGSWGDAPALPRGEPLSDPGYPLVWPPRL